MAFNYRRANQILLALIIVINGYVIAAPFWPQLMFWYQERTPRVAQLSATVEKPEPIRPDQSLPNGLTIPKMMFEGPIHQGTDTYAELEKGVWLWPHGSRPDKGSNTIMLGHRFTYTNPRGAFYFLDKLSAGDKLGVIWENKRYVYDVVSSRTVSPSEVSILNPTSEPTLTLYTCTPLWNPTQRLVITARLQENT